MYKRDAQEWAKHFDFFLIDMVSLQSAYILAVAIRLHRWAFAQGIYRDLGFVLFLVEFMVLALNNTMHNVLKRDFRREVSSTFRQCFFVFAIATIFLFATQSGDDYSRIVVFLTFVLHLLLGWITRAVWKQIVKRRRSRLGKKRSMLLVATSETVSEILHRLNENTADDFKIVGVVLADDADKKEINGYSVVADMAHAADYICREWVDSVYIDAPISNEQVVKLMDDCSIMAIPVHFHVPNMSRNGVKRFSEKIGGTTVLTTSINYATPLQLVAKRCLDILGGIVGSVLALIILAIVGPFIVKDSPGPVIFRQERIGKNGKHFKIYKIRSMYMDAEDRKKELMAQNRVKDGMMFKLDFDPRIIGNEILPDGSKKTGIGDFIRRTSLDEFPQFFNVLLGQMSLVGTRPPTPDEWNKYEYHHRARLAIKPGITGMWQVNGRSEITDFEEVVRLDTEYITNWSLGLDIRILFKTIGVLLKRKGAM